MKRAFSIAMLAALFVALGVPRVDAWLNRRTPVPVATTFPLWAFVTSQDTFVEVRDLQTPGFDILTTIDFLGGQTYGIANNPASHLAYIVLQGPDQVQIVDTQSFAKLGAISFTGGSQLREIAISPDASHIYVTGFDGGANSTAIFVATISGNTLIEQPAMKQVTGSVSNVVDVAFSAGSPHRLYYSLGLGPLFMVNMGAGFDASSAASTLAGPSPAERIVADPNGSRVYVSSFGAAPYFVDTTTQVSTPMTISDPAPGGPADLAIGGPNLVFTSLYSPLTSNYEVNAIDRSTGLFTGASAGVSYAETISCDPGARALLYMGDGVIEVLDISTGAPTYVAQANNSSTYYYYKAIFTPPSGPVIHSICPRGGFGLAGETIRVEGVNFSPIAKLQIVPISGPIDLAIVSQGPNFIEGTLVSPMLSGQRYDIIVDNQVPAASPLKTTVHKGYTVAASPGTSFTVPMPSGQQMSDYRMRSFAQITTSAQGLAALLVSQGPYDPSSYRMFMWDAKSQQYVEMPDMSSSDCDWTGNGFWILSVDGGSATANGTDSLSAVSNLPVPLHPGWNIISDPFPLNEVNWSDTLGTQDAFAGPYGTSLSDGTGAFPGSSMSLSRLFEWDGSQYVTTDTMQPGKAYWVENKTPGIQWAWLTPGTISTGVVFAAPAVFTAPNPADHLPPPPPGGLNASGGSPNCSFGVTSGLGVTLLLVGILAILIGTIVRTRIACRR